MFETYQFSGVYIAIQAVLTLYAQGTLPHHNCLTSTVINCVNILCHLDDIITKKVYGGKKRAKIQ